MTKLTEQDNEQTEDTSLTDSSQINMKQFEAWCKEFNVGVRTNRNTEIEVRIGDNIKFVCIDSISL
jgi:hypothetical protein